MTSQPSISSSATHKTSTLLALPNTSLISSSPQSGTFMSSSFVGSNPIGASIESNFSFITLSHPSQMSHPLLLSSLHAPFANLLYVSKQEYSGSTVGP
ncbi:hypothetical protein ADUPG1_005135, partial [Aduncisulcus paluster]